MKTSMIEYVKIVLRKVSFDRRLFRKEFRKSLLWLNQSEIRDLKKWLREQGLVPATHRNAPLNH